jgi:hypothetical protein
MQFILCSHLGVIRLFIDQVSDWVTPLFSWLRLRFCNMLFASQEQLYGRVAVTITNAAIVCRGVCR